MTQPVTTADQILDAQRFARASKIVEGTCAYDDNECRLDTDKPTPRYLVLEYGSMPDDICNFWQDETFADAACNIDCSETDDVRIASVVDLDTGVVYEADRRTVGFNNIGSHEDLPDTPDTDEPLPARINIAPANLSTFMPGVLPATPMTDAEHEAALGAELDKGSAASKALADHLVEMGAGHLTHTVDTPNGKVEIIARYVRPENATIVTVSGGVAEAAQGDPVTIIDYDNLRESLNDDDEVELEPEARAYLAKYDAEFLAELDAIGEDDEDAEQA